MSEKYPRVILHFDVNKTLIMVDKAANKPIGVVCNQILMQNIYGRVTGTPKVDPNVSPSRELLDEYIGNFELEYIHEKIESDDKNDYQEYREDSVSFERFVSEWMYPLYKKEEGEVALSSARIKEHNGRSKKRRVEIMERFLDTSIGERFRAFREELFKKMTIINPYSIVPAFYVMMEYLMEKEFDFRIVFRTFGDDIDILIEEFNEYCTGKHKLHEGKVFLKSKMMDMKDPNRIGHVFRSVVEGDRLIIGNIGPSDIVEFSEERSVQVLQKPRDIHDYFVNGKDDETLAIRDHYHFWNMNGEFNRFGKIFVVDKRERNVLQMFFDDNMVFGGKKKGIVDLMDISGEHLDVLKYHGLYLHTVNPLRVVVNDRYFIGRLEKALKRFKEI